MGDVVEEAMDSSAVSEEEVGDLQREESIPRRSCSKISDVGEIIEGKRAKKTVERLDFQAPKVKEKLKIAVGSGDKLGDIPRTNYEINKRKADELKLLHSILFDRPGKSASVKKNLRLFNGFPFDADSSEFTKKREKMLKKSNLNNTKLKLICTVLDLEKKGTHLDLIDRILNFLIAPKNSGKRAPVKKKKRSKKKLSGNDSKAKSKPKAKSSSSSSKKSKAGSKSKAIVMDSSSDEEDEEKMGTSVEAEGSDGEEKPSEQDGEQEEQSDKSEESEEEELEESDESSKPKSSRGKKKKNAVEKRQRTPAKKTGRPKKRARNHRSDESDGDSDSEEKPKKKRVAAAKTKKADSSSSSNKNTTNAAEDSSDDDEPLIRIIKKAPTDDQLKKIVENLLKEANLEEMTMKQICQKVFDTYPEHDLSGRKDFIKQTVKTFIT